MPDQQSKPDFAAHFHRGIDHFNAREFWDAHEAWETIWLAAESEAHEFLQGLIQIAAAYHHLQRGTFSGAVRLFDAALRRLEPFPPSYCGIERAPLIAACIDHRAWTEQTLLRGKRDGAALSARLQEQEYPVIDASEPSSLLPPAEKW